MRCSFALSLAGLVLVLAGTARPADSSPKVVPTTRPDMKKALDDLKKRQPRLPLPPLTKEEKEKRDGRSVGNNGRMRRLYLPPELRGEFGRGAETNMTLDRTYKTMFFWIVARSNNCHYCLGHQENKLASSGIAEAKIAALDSDWLVFTPAEQAAFAFVRKLTHQPHKIGVADIAALRKHYSDLQALEVLVSACGHNAMTRWTDATGIPQEGHRVFLTATAEKYRDSRSKVAPLTPEARPALETRAQVEAAPLTPEARPALETRAQVEAALASARKRTPRLPLVAQEKARAVLPADWPKGPLPQWARLLANFPKAGVSRANSFRHAEEKGALSKRLRAQIGWIAARHDRAWYALGRARLRLQALGLSDDQIFALDGSAERFTPAERAAFSFARKLTVTPYRVADDDVAGLRKHFKDGEVAEMIYHITAAAYFNRLTEAAGLQLEAR